MKEYYVLMIDLSKLSLSKEEISILEIMRENFSMHLLYEHQNSNLRNQENINIIRGMKYAFDAIQSSEDGFKQSIEWQATLY